MATLTYSTSCTSPYIITEGRNASFFGLDINIAVGEPAQGMTRHFSILKGLVFRGNRLYCYKQRHRLHKHRSGDPVLLYSFVISLSDLNLKSIRFFVFFTHLYCIYDLPMNCLFVLVLGINCGWSSHGVGAILALIQNRRRDLISIWRSRCVNVTLDDQQPLLIKKKTIVGCCSLSSVLKGTQTRISSLFYSECLHVRF